MNLLFRLSRTVLYKISLNWNIWRSRKGNYYECLKESTLQRLDLEKLIASGKPNTPKRGLFFVISCFYNKNCPLYLLQLVNEVLERGHRVCLINTGNGEIPSIPSERFVGGNRKNIGYDFASYLILREYIEKNFSDSFIIFMNDSVWYLEPEALILHLEKLQKKRNVGILYGMNDSYETKRHLQSFFFAGTFNPTFSILMKNLEKHFYPLPARFKGAVIAIEFQFTSEAERLGLKVQPFFDYLELRAKSAFLADGFFSNPTHKCAAFFLKCSIPFVKKDLIIKEIVPDFLRSEEFRKEILTNASRRKVLADILVNCR